MENHFDFSIASLGDATVPSPIVLSKRLDDYIANYVGDHQRVIYDIDVMEGDDTYPLSPRMLMELAGPREKIFFDPSKVSAAIVTCGGLCPGLNDVIRSIVMSLWYLYGVREIHGIRYGYRGFLPEMHMPPKPLTPDVVSDIHRHGGTILGSARGGGNRTSEIVDALERMNVDLLFAIGGDGTQKGALAITEEIKKRKKNIAVIGVPKTIDNDLSFVEKSFGFETAVSYAVQSVAGAHTEAQDALDGIGMVKVMGRESGFIAAHTALAINDVNFVLVPEVPFDLEGEAGFLEALEKRLDRRHHAVILLAEGAGQEHLEASAAVDASGNKKMGDIGLFMKDVIAAHFKKKDREINIKYIDPSYIIRSAPANPNDSIYCQRLGSNAAHAAMAGKTGCLISRLNNRLVHIPIWLATSKRNKIDPESALWRDVIEATGQPHLMLPKEKRV